MENIEINKYPLLKGDKELEPILNDIGRKELIILGLKTNADNLIKKIQKNCHHKNEQNNTSEHRYKPTFVETILDSKTCLDCGHVEERPKGRRWEICYHCWGQMKYVRIEPGQGGRTFHYECTNCKHEETHT